jgi:hypothetical protein
VSYLSTATTPLEGTEAREDEVQEHGDAWMGNREH